MKKDDPCDSGVIGPRLSRLKPLKYSKTLNSMTPSGRSPPRGPSPRELVSHPLELPRFPGGRQVALSGEHVKWRDKTGLSCYALATGAGVALDPLPIPHLRRVRWPSKWVIGCPMEP